MKCGTRPAFIPSGTLPGECPFAITDTIIPRLPSMSIVSTYFFRQIKRKRRPTEKQNLDFLCILLCFFRFFPLFSLEKPPPLSNIHQISYGRKPFLYKRTSDDAGFSTYTRTGCAVKVFFAFSRKIINAHLHSGKFCAML